MARVVLIVEVKINQYYLTEAFILLPFAIAFGAAPGAIAPAQCPEALP